MTRFALGTVLLFLCLGTVAAAEPELLLRVERQTRQDLEHLLEAGLPVVHELNPCLLVEGSAEHLALLEQMGYAATVLDSEPRSWDYRVVGLRPDSDLEAVESVGTIIHREENWVLLRTAPGTELGPLWAARTFVGPVGHEPLSAPRGPDHPRARGAEGTDGTADPLVQQIVDEVSDTQIMSYWQDLANNPPTGSRYSRGDGCVDAAAYCHDLYGSLGIPAEYQNWNVDHAPNVIGTRLGALHPERVYMAIAHLDDLPSSGLAPGADDNGSGSVWVLEAARAMQCQAFRNTIKFLNATGEEQGLLGAEAYADDAEARGENILGVINMDMPGWEGNGSPDPEDLDLDYNGPSEDLALRFVDAASTYSTGLAVNAIYCPSLTASDHAAFWAKGWDAIIGITDNEGYCGQSGNYPHYHTSDDTIANCGDPAFFYSVVRTSVATLAELAEPFRIAFERDFTGCDGTIRLVVGDGDLNTDPGLQESISVNVWSDTETAPETFLLLEEGTDSMIFSATVPTSPAAPVPGDGVVSAVHGDLLQASYTDALDCDGAVDVEYVASAQVDCVYPIISSVGEENVSDVAAEIVWTTDEAASSEVIWGETPPPGSPAASEGMTTSHRVTLDGLQECTVYYYEVRSADEAANLAVDDSGGQYYRFETLIDFGSGLQSCHAGQVSVSPAVTGCDDLLDVELSDADLNLSPETADSVTVTVSSTTEPGAETLVLTETGPNTSRFTGSLALEPAPMVPKDGVLQVSDADLITATYRDEDDGTGLAAVSFDTAQADCAGPAITDLRVEAITNARALVRWTTSEPASSTLEWGATAALGETVQSPALVTEHELLLNQFDTCETGYLRVSSTDVHGNTALADLNGSPFSFDTWDIPGLYWRDSFENGAGAWTLEGEWEVGEAQGLGGSSGNPDPDEAYNNLQILGSDLSGQGAHPGDYEPLIAEFATSEILDAKAWTNTRLLLYRQLNVSSGDLAAIIVDHGQGTPVWSNQNTTYLETDYSPQSIDIGPIADGVKNLSLRFLIETNATGHYSGWNIDDVILKDGSLPDYAACGGCGSAPSFAGASLALDDDACAATGVTVSWDPAVSWGSGTSGTYALYRDTSPEFTPSAGNRVASGIPGTSYLDTGAPLDQPLYYLVRAENDESCSAGPANGGVEDGNLVRVAVRDDTSQPAPGPVGATLVVEKVNDAHTRLSWSAAAGAATYRVYRGEDPQGPFLLLTEIAETLFEDRDELGNLNGRYYRVVAVDACGNEGG